MIKEYKEKIEQTYHEYYCDLCGKRVYDDNSIEYEEESYNFGSDGCYFRKQVYDVCKDCMKNIIFPYIKEKTGKEPRIYEKDW